MNVEFEINEIAVDEALLHGVDRAGLALEIQQALANRPSVVDGVSSAAWIPRFTFAASGREIASMGATVADAVTNALGGGDVGRTLGGRD